MFKGRWLRKIRISLTAFVAILTGLCTVVNVASTLEKDNQELEKGVAYCKDKGGVNKFDNTGKQFIIQCINGKHTTLNVSTIGTKLYR